MKVIVFSLIISTLACGSSAEYYHIRGTTMGTYYQISYQNSKPISQDVIDLKLEKINRALSTYDPSSIVSKFNQSSHGLNLSSVKERDLVQYFFDNITISSNFYKKSDGFFDPTVMPLVNYWGFGYKGDHVAFIDSNRIDSLINLVGFDKMYWDMDNDSIWKDNPNSEVDFSAVAKGYAIDVLGEFLKVDFFIENFLIDIGGESLANGVNEKGVPWRVGINSPEEHADYADYGFVVELKNRAIATSGNYRNFYEVDGQKISHTINPLTGFFERNDLLSASVVAGDCATADAAATACMAMGYQKALAFVEGDSSLDALFIYISERNKMDHHMTSGLSEYVTKRN